MSHLKAYKTKIENLEYLKTALNRLHVFYYVLGQNIILPQTKMKNALFQWNGENYTFFYDIDFWTNSLTINSFTEKVTQEYSAEKVAQGMKKFNFQIESYTDSIYSNSHETVKSKSLVFSRYLI